MMPARDGGNAADLFGPGNLLQKIEGVHYVRFDLQPLGIVQRTFADGKQPYFIGIEQRPPLLAVVAVLPRRDAFQHVEAAFRQHRRLVGLQNGLEPIIHFLQLVRQLLIEARQLGQKLFPAFLQHIVQPGAQRLGLNAALHKIKALADDVYLRGIKFFGLDQHFFPHPHFAKIVQQRGVADLLHGRAIEAHLRVRAGVQFVHGFRERHRKIGHPEGMA